MKRPLFSIPLLLSVLTVCNPAPRASAAETMASVFDDAQFAIEITADTNGNGDIDSAELHDFRKVFTTEGATFYPHDGNTSLDKPVFEMDDVRFQALGVTARVPTWRVEPRMFNALADSWASPGILLDEDAPSGDFTLVLRLKWDGATITTKNWNGATVTFDTDSDYMQTIVRAGFNGGWRFGVQPDGRPTFVDSHSGNWWATPDIVFEPGVWYDFAVIGIDDGDSDSVAFYALDSDDGFPVVKWWDYSLLNGTDGNVFFGPKRYWGGFSPNGQNILSNAGDSLDGFNGNLQFFAMWNRALSSDEIHEAWRKSGAGRWSIGLRNNAHPYENGLQEFGGHQDTTFYANAGSNWIDFPSCVDAGHSATVSFNLVKDEEALPFLLQLCGVNIRSAYIDVSANNRSVGRVKVSDEHAGLLYLPGGTFAAGTNTLTLAVESGSGAWEPDYLGLFGSFLQGEKDDTRWDDTAWDEFGDVAESRRMRLWTENRNCRGLCRTLRSDETWSMSMNVTREIAERCAFTFSLSTIAWSETLQAFLLVNGEEVCEFWPHGADTATIDIPVGFFQPGENVIEIHEAEHPYGSGAYIAVDFFQMEVGEPPPEYPTDTIILFR